MSYVIKSTDWADTTSIGEWDGREDDAVSTYNTMLEMLAELISEDDDESWNNATHYLWNLVGSDEDLPDYNKEQMKLAVQQAA